ncbi:aminodeoxychorismate synthase component I [Testudinibacter sp. TR-2022]|uniref:aminodeoxychorismate synthase component I n=1 Tax=Testudinibacter sp. TR-2022 TaxID=2585029 RepID=UPI002279D210|nr:aminodeoxychorismate synthase component I [Testudinibacter sp. TR-2022]
MMSRQHATQHAIAQANHFGQTRQPFLFLIDFEQRNPLVLPLNEAAAQGIYYDIKGATNRDWQLDKPNEPLQMTRSPISFERYRQGFEIVQQGLQAGNTYLLNLTYPTALDCNYSLRQIFQFSQAPFKVLLDDQFVCFSPESFVTTAENKIYSYPMKGTIDAALDNAEQRLLASEKEQWEHNTIVDLIRNDLSIVATQIEVSRFRYVERLQTERGSILQTSSEICGQLAADWQNRIGDLLFKLLPAGSISGAPKEKTLDIIRQAELDERGYYSGIFGIFDGENLQSAVLIRYLQQQGEQLLFRSGCGITAQSCLQDEYQEMLQKVYIPIVSNEVC